MSARRFAIGVMVILLMAGSTAATAQPSPAKKPLGNMTCDAPGESFWQKVKAEFKKLEKEM